MSASDDEIQRLANEALQAAQHDADAGRPVQASELYRAVLALQPECAQAHFGLGLLEREGGNVGAAIPHFASALQAAPGEAAYWLTYIDALMDARQFGTAAELIGLGRQHGLAGPAVDAFERQLDAGSEPDPGDVEAAAALYAQGRMEAAGDAARALTERFPQHGFGWKLLAAVLYKKRDLAEAMGAMRLAVHYAPDDAETLCNFGLLLKRSGQYDEAKSVLERSIALRPDNPDAHTHLAGTLADLGLLEEAHASVTRVLELSPDSLDAWHLRAVIYELEGRTDEAVATYRRVLAQKPDHLDTRCNLLFCLSHTVGVPPAELFQEHRRYGQLLEARAAALGAAPAWDNTREAGRCLRIGFVSGDLRHHAVASFITPVLEQLAGRPGVSLYAYYNFPAHDHITAQLRALVPQWRDIAELDDIAVERLIRADGIDILIDLAGPTAFNRLPVFARKAAPLQATWIGYPGTTGLSTMDYLLTDRHLAPPGRFDDQFTEKLVHLPLLAPFTPFADAPGLVPPPALENGYLSFGSFNRLSKYSPQVIALWSRLLRGVPDARLILAGMPEGGGGYDKLRGWLRDEGIDLARVRFHPRMGMRDYLALHNEIDLCLDTFPYSGGTTTFHALYMGVPMLTIAGKTMAGRQTVCALEHSGLPQFVARDADDFVRKGIAASADLAALAELRAGLRGSSPLWAADAMPWIADGLENALRQMWERWCAGLAPVSFEVPASGGGC
ncbi:MAG: tetratricopeptide repeat protein [Lysobacteraceae bacterium]|nr:MAG: tetratricopeptide repeat protein [Xanthomonadaceae bacterium]